MDVLFEPFKTLFLFQTQVSLKMRGAGFAGLSAEDEVLALLAEKSTGALKRAWVVQCEHPVPGSCLVYYYTAHLTLTRHVTLIQAFEFRPQHFVTLTWYHHAIIIRAQWVGESAFETFLDNHVSRGTYP